jgi:hypothetical protein
MPINNKMSFVNSFCVPFVSIIQKYLKVSEKEALDFVVKGVESYTNTTKTCEYIYLRSPKKGYRCESSIDKKSDKFCSKHMKKGTEEKKKVVRKKENIEKVRTKKNKEVTEFKDSLQSYIDKQKSILLIKVCRNKYGNYQQLDSEFIIDPVTKEVIGLQKEDRVEDLTKENIEKCLSMNLKYRLPLSLSEEREQVETTNDVPEEDFDEDEDDCYEDDE